MNKYLAMIAMFLYATPAFANTEQLINAVKDRDIKVAQKLIENGENVNGANNKGNTAIHYAVASENLPMVKMLLEKGANIDSKNTKGWSAYMIAERQENSEIFALLDKKKNANKKVVPMVKLQPAQKIAKKTDKKVENNVKDAKKVIKTTSNKNKNLQSKKEEKAKQVKAVPNSKMEKSALSSEIYKGDEEIVYCLNFLGMQSEQKSMKVASGYFAIECGLQRQRHDKAIDISTKYYDNSSEENLRERAKECSKIITPKAIYKQNQIIRSLNKAMGY